MPISKRCSKCRKVKPIAQFNRRQASPDGYTYKCKECEKITAKANYHKRKKKLSRNRYYEQNKERIKAKSRAYYIANREHLLKKNKEYRQRKPEVHRKSTERRKKVLQANKGKPYTRSQIIERDSRMINGRLVPICWICNEPVRDFNELQIDHVIPITAGGKDCRDNVRVAHRICNIQRPMDGSDVAPKKT